MLAVFGAPARVCAVLLLLFCSQLVAAWPARNIKQDGKACRMLCWQPVHICRVRSGCFLQPKQLCSMIEGRQLRCYYLGALLGPLLTPMSCDRALLRRLSWDTWAEEALGLLSRAEGGRGRLRLGVWFVDRLALTCCRLSSRSCCLLNDVPLAILQHITSLTLGSFQLKHAPLAILQHKAALTLGQFQLKGVPLAILRHESSLTLGHFQVKDVPLAIRNTQAACH